MKKEYIIPVLIIISLAAYLALRSTDQTHYELPSLNTIENGKIDRLKITLRKSDSVELVKKDDKWFIEPKGYLADIAKVTKMLQEAAGLTVTELVSESSNYQRYDLDDDKKINIQVFEGGNKIREFDIGRVAPTYKHTFARQLDNPNIYYAQNAMKTTFDHTVNTLRDKTVHTFKADAVNEMEIRKGELSLVIAKKEIPAKAETEAKETTQTPTKENPADAASASAQEIQWQDTQHQPMDKKSVDSLLKTLSDLKCESYLEDNAKDTLKNPSWTVTVKTDADTTYTLAVFPLPPSGDGEEENEFVSATSSANQYAFELPNHKAKSMETHLDKLLGIEIEEGGKE